MTTIIRLIAVLTFGVGIIMLAVVDSNQEDTAGVVCLVGLALYLFARWRARRERASRTAAAPEAPGDAP